MKLEKRYNNRFSDKYVCDLTKELDDVSEIHYDGMFHHYILADDWCKNQKYLAIRVSGGTVGGIYYDENNIITKIVINTDYVVKTYPTNINEFIQKFVGEIIEW